MTADAKEPMRDALKRLARHLPLRLQQEAKRHHFARQLHRGLFTSPEPEFQRLDEWLEAGEWALDIGANVGHYTVRLSEIVGATGRVIAFEPMPETFELLAANLARRRIHNVTLFNAAASSTTGILRMIVPSLSTGLRNYYRAQITPRSSGVSVLGMRIDGLDIPHPVKLVKIDVEGHELSVLKGMVSLIERDHPILIVEDQTDELARYLARWAYTHETLTHSPNRVFGAPAPTGQEVGSRTI